MTDRASARRISRLATLGLVLAAALLSAGCQAIFTFSPVAGLQQSPSNMTPAQRLTYAQDALASGDQAAMKTAYDAIKNDTSGPAQYTTAQLGIELSGVPAVLVQVANDPSSVTTQLNTINDYVTSHNIDPNYMVAASTQLAAAAAAGVPLTTMDYAMGAMGMLLGDAHASSATWNVTSGTVTTAQATAARAFLAPAVTNVASLPSGDPLQQFITQLDTFIGGL